MIKSQADNYFFLFCIVDIFFFPYFPLLTFAFSMPVVLLWWYIRKDELDFDKEYKMVFLAILLIILSTVYSFVVYPANIKDNLVYVLEMSTVFAYYVMFKYFFKNYNVDLEQWLFYFVLFVLAFVVVYNFDKGLYQTIKYIWNARMASVWYTDILSGYRFGFVWMDENNIAYMMNTISFLLIVSKKVGVVKKIIALSCCLLVVVSSMSSGGRTSLILLWAVYLLYRVLTFKGKIKIHRRLRIKKLLAVILTIVLVIVILYMYLPSFFTGTIFKESKNRAEENSMDSRYRIWKDVFYNTNWLMHIIIGHGGRTMVDGEARAPHNGHFYWILAYGMIVYFIYMYIFFRKRKTMEIVHWIAMIPYFLGFSINTMVGEPKINGLIALIVAYYSTRVVINGKEESVLVYTNESQRYSNVKKNV